MARATSFCAHELDGILVLRRIASTPHTGGEMGRTERRRVEQRDRLKTAEAAAFAYYGIDAVSEPLVLDEPPMTTRVIHAGQGPPTVLLHGSTLTSTAWAPLLPHLPGRALYLVDLPGCGLADRFDYTSVDLAAHQTAFVGSVLDALGLEEAALIGASMGGWFALRFAIERPERVTAVALVTAPAIALPGSLVPVPMAVTSTWLGRRLAVITPPPSARMTRQMLARIGGDGSVAGVPDAMFEALGAAMALAVPSNTTLDLYRWRTPHANLQIRDEELRACQPPVLLLWGDQDVVSSPASGERAARLLPHGRLEVLRGGHGLWFDLPAECGRLLSAFLEQADQQPT